MVFQSRVVASCVERNVLLGIGFHQALSMAEVRALKGEEYKKSHLLCGSHPPAQSVLCGVAVVSLCREN